MKKWIAMGGVAAVLAAGAALWASSGSQATNNDEDVSIDFDRYEAAPEDPAPAQAANETPEPADQAPEPAGATDETGEKTTETDIQVLGVEQERPEQQAAPRADRKPSPTPTLQQINPNIRDDIGRNHNLVGLNTGQAIPKNLRQVNPAQFDRQNLPVPDENDQ